MIETVRRFVDGSGFDVMLIFSVLVSLFAIVTTVYSSIFAVRAKRRAMYAIRRARLDDSQLRDLLGLVDKQKHLQPSEIDAVRKAIREHLTALSKQDRRYVDAGLNQNSIRGFERFVGEIVGHEHAA